MSFFKDTATPEIYTLSLHDALPIYSLAVTGQTDATALPEPITILLPRGRDLGMMPFSLVLLGFTTAHARSEEHTSELQSRQYLVCRLLLEKKNINACKKTRKYRTSF